VADEEGTMKVTSLASMLLILSLSSVSLSYAEAVWYFPFSELGAVWTPGGNWAVGPSSLFVSESLTGPPSGLDSSAVYCTIPAIPPSTRYLTLMFSDDWSMSGSCTGGWAYTLFEARFSINGGTFILMASEYGTTENPYTPGYYDDSDSRPITYPVFADSGDQVVFRFVSYVEGQATSFTASGIWTISNMSLVGHGTVDLDPQTWGLIKSQFI
jgi:hypothetical protein